MESCQCPYCQKVFVPAIEKAGMALFCPHCNKTVLLPKDDITPNDSLGGFKIIKLIGKGGTGNVYLAEQTSMQRLVALKVLPKDFIKDKKIIARFLKEVQLSGQLNHPNIVTTIDAGEDKGHYYLAITYVDGEDFVKRLERESSIPEKEALELGLKIGEALGYAWEKHGLFHKDIKPGNIMKNKKGKIFLMDMGIAQSAGESPLEYGHVLGSPFYMSPEQGKGKSLDWKSDLYSLGATLYHLIVGVPPYDDEDVIRILKKHITDPFPEPLSRNPNARISKYTVLLLKKMMAKNPEARFKSWKEFQQAAKKVVLRIDKNTDNKKHSFYSFKNISSLKSGTTVSSLSPRLKKHSPYIYVLNYLAIISVTVMAACFIYNYNKNLQVEHCLETAENYYHKYPWDYPGALEFFMTAKKKAKGTKYETQIITRYSEVYSAATAFQKEVELFEDAIKKAKDLLRQKKYEDAIAILEPVKTIKDPLKKRQAETLITLIKMTIKRRRGN